MKIILSRDRTQMIYENQHATQNQSRPVHQTKLSTAAIATIAVELCKLSDDERSRFPSCLKLAFDEMCKYESIVVRSNVQPEPPEDPSPHTTIAAESVKTLRTLKTP